jgi:hypothetical protein
MFGDPRLDVVGIPDPAGLQHGDGAWEVWPFDQVADTLSGHAESFDHLGHSHQLHGGIFPLWPKSTGNFRG